MKQREIKFRAWNKDNSDPMFNPFESGLRFETFVNAPSIELMQYTGLKDKNGVEIFEGDITNYGTVKWFNHLTWDGAGSDHPGFYFIQKRYGMRELELDYHLGFDEEIEVIGNIYENPELLK